MSAEVKKNDEKVFVDVGQQKRLASPSLLFNGRFYAGADRASPEQAMTILAQASQSKMPTGVAEPAQNLDEKTGLFARKGKSFFGRSKVQTQSEVGKVEPTITPGKTTR